MAPFVLGLLGVGVLVVVLLISAIRILPEYERGVVFRLGRLQAERLRTGPVPADPDRRPHGPHLACEPWSTTCRRRTSSRKDNVSLKVNAVVYFRVMNPRKRDGRGRELPLRHQPAGADDAALGTGPGRAGRTAVGARQDQPRAADDPGPADRPLGHQGLRRRGQARRSPAGDAARDGQAGRGRAREAGQDHPRPRRGQAAARRWPRPPRNWPRTRLDAATLPADPDRDRLGAELDADLPAPGGASSLVREVDGSGRSSE